MDEDIRDAIEHGRKKYAESRASRTQHGPQHSDPYQEPDPAAKAKRILAANAGLAAGDGERSFTLHETGEEYMGNGVFDEVVRHVDDRVRHRPDG